MKRRVNNIGATFVLVIVCMLFVGIIAAAVLTLTVGNTKNLETSEKSTDSFYSAESIVDGLKKYLQKYANEAAVKAYAKTLSDYANGTITSDSQMEAKFEENFKDELTSQLGIAMSETDIKSLITDGVYDADGKSLSSSAKFTFAWDTYTDGIIKNVRIKYTDENGYEAEIVTDIKIKGKMPAISWDGSETSFGYDVDKFIIVADGNVTTGETGTATGSIVGSIYAGKEMKFSVPYTKLGEAWPSLDIKAGKLISKDDLTLHGPLINVAKFNTNNTKTLERFASNVTPINENVNIWTNGVNVEGSEGASEGTTVGTNVVVDYGNVYVKDDLSLNEQSPAFQMKNGGEYVGFSADIEGLKVVDEEGNVTDEHKDSSAIVINGVDALLDLENTEVYLNGVAYTEVPQVAGSNTNVTFMMQGESITYRAIQNAYLIPGTAIDGYGRNPIRTADISNLSNISITDNTTLGLGSKGYKTANVAYVSAGDEFTYFYYNFGGVNKAVQYFNTLYTMDNSFKNAIISKAGMYGTTKYADLIKNGTNKVSRGIHVSESKLHTRGNVITYDIASEKFGYVAKDSDDTGYSDKCATGSKSYGNVVKTLSVQGKPGAKDDLFENLFVTNDENRGLALVEKVLDGSNVKTFDLFQGTNTLSEWVYDTITVKNYTVDKGDILGGYKLVLAGEQGIAVGGDSNNKYIVISLGDVVVSGNFKGIIFSKKDVLISNNVDLECLGNVYSETRGGEEDVDQYISEFDAILSVVPSTESETDGNVILRKIFNVAGTNGLSAGESNQGAGDMADILTENWLKK